MCVLRLRERAKEMLIYDLAIFIEFVRSFAMRSAFISQILCGEL